MMQTQQDQSLWRHAFERVGGDGILLVQLRTVTGGNLTNDAMMRMFVMGKVNGLDVEQIERLATLAVKAPRGAIADSFDEYMTHAVRQSREKALGEARSQLPVTRADFERARVSFAARLAKQTDELTDAEKSSAFINAICGSEGA